MGRCCVDGCNTNTGYTFPSATHNPVVRQMWIEATSRFKPKGWQPVKGEVVCRNHFKWDSFKVGKFPANVSRLINKYATISYVLKEKEVKSRSYLLEHAVPTIFPWSEENLKTDDKKRVPKGIQRVRTFIMEEESQKAQKCGSKVFHQDHLAKAVQLMKNKSRRKKKKNQKDDVETTCRVGPEYSLRYMTPSSTQYMMEQLRLALMQHQWDVAIDIVNNLILVPFTEKICLRACLQIFCHHPNSSAELLQNFLKICLQSRSLPNDDFFLIFCTTPHQTVTI